MIRLCMQMEQIDVAGTDKNLQTYPVVSSPRRLMPGPSLLIQLKAKVVVKSINNTIRSSQKTPADPSCSSSHHRFSVGLSLLYVIPEKSKKRRKEPTSSSRMPSFYFALVIRTHTHKHTCHPNYKEPDSAQFAVQTEASFIVIVIVHLVLL